VAADSTPAPLQGRYASNWLLNKFSDEITMGSGVSWDRYGKRHQYQQQGSGGGDWENLVSVLVIIISVHVVSHPAEREY
jgi:hypothetical protein